MKTYKIDFSSEINIVKKIRRNDGTTEGRIVKLTLSDFTLEHLAFVNTFEEAVLVESLMKKCGQENEVSLQESDMSILYQILSQLNTDAKIEVNKLFSQWNDGVDLVAYEKEFLAGKM